MLDTAFTKGNIHQKCIINKFHQITSDIIRNRAMYIFVMPALIYFIIFKYMPVYFVQIAFRDYWITRNVVDCDWVGMENFAKLFNTPGFSNALKNTLIISFYKIMFGFPMPIILALLLNEIGRLKFKKLTQTLIYLPHFISWSIIGGVMYGILSVESGLLNEIIKLFGKEPIFFLGDKSYFRGVLVVSDIWKEMGWGAILYLAAITNINYSLYEAAIIDGANRMQRLWYITISGIKSTIIILLIIKLGKMLDVGFEQILVLSNPMVQPVADVLDTYVFRVGLEQGRHSVGAAAGLFKTVVAGIMIYSSDRISKMFGERGLF
jgi:putative aldouronate transport system permease protein